MRILFLCTDAFGGHGGIAKFNRDLLSACCASPDVEEVVALPRLMPDTPGELSLKLRYETSGLGGKLRYLRAVARVARRGTAPNPNAQSSTGFDLILCGHINLLPAAFLARKLLHPQRRPALHLERGKVSRCSPPLALVVHGIEAWQPTRSWLANRLVRHIDAVISVSDFTRRRFLPWARLDQAQSFLLPNCVDLERTLQGCG